MTKQAFFAPSVNPFSTITGRLTDPLLVVLPQRVRRPETQVGFGFQNQLAFDKDSDHSLVFFDFASEELLYSAVLSQAYHGGKLGSDPFMKAMLTGSKEDGTDVYSLVAKSIGIKRNQSKGAVLGSLYGMGKKSYITTLLQSIDSPKERERVRPIAGDAFTAFKGSKDRMTGKLTGGIASNFFNYVNRNINSDLPKFGPFGLDYPKSLNKAYWKSRRTTSAINYAVQSSCALGGMLSTYISLASAEFKSETLSETQVRYAGSIHDCIIFIVKDDCINQVAKCLIRSYVSVWAHVFDYFSLGSLPQRIITDIVLDVSKELRKDAFATIKTPEYSTDKTGFQLFVSPETGKLHKRNSEADQAGFAV